MILASRLVDSLLGPHGIDRYLELIAPTLTITDPRALVTRVHRQTDRSVTLTIKPNTAFTGFSAGQFVRVGVEINGVRKIRTFSPASADHDKDQLELTVTLRDNGLVSNYLRDNAKPGMLLHLSEASGTFTLPAELPDQIALISGGSGVTPVLSMLRTLLHGGHCGPIDFIHYARTCTDHLYRGELEALVQTHSNLSVHYRATREGDAHLGPDQFGHIGADAHVAVCGPQALIDAAKDLWPHAQAETFTAPTLLVSGEQATGTLRFVSSGTSAAIASGSLLEQAEAAGLNPEFGCRMGICQTCTCRKQAGAIKNLITGEISDEEDVNIQLCISVPAGDVALEL
jgi:ferredoxin-NADP reductase